MCVNTKHHNSSNPAICEKMSENKEFNGKNY